MNRELGRYAVSRFPLHVTSHNVATTRRLETDLVSGQACRTGIVIRPSRSMKQLRSRVTLGSRAPSISRSQGTCHSSRARALLSSSPCRRPFVAVVAGSRCQFRSLGRRLEQNLSLSPSTGRQQSGECLRAPGDDSLRASEYLVGAYRSGTARRLAGSPRARRMARVPMPSSDDRRLAWEPKMSAFFRGVGWPRPAGKSETSPANRCASREAAI
jgi:hypothetical protein